MVRALSGAADPCIRTVSYLNILSRSSIPLKARPPWTCASAKRTRISAARRSAWLEENLSGEFAVVRGRGGTGDEGSLIEERKAWERRLGEGGWIGIGWPKESGGRGLPLTQQVIFYEEYARAGGPGRIGHMSEGLLAPTVIAYGTEEQKQRILPPILKGEEIWCQGYSEPNAGSDLANVQTKARLEGDEWVIDGQKVWTSWAEWADWCFVVCRTDPDSQRHKGLSYLLVPMKGQGDRDPAHHPDHRRRGVQRGLLRRRAHGEGEHPGRPR